MTTIREKFITTARGRLSLMEDFTFKAVFGRESTSSGMALIDLLNVILDLHGDDAIKSLTIRNPYIPGDTRITKESVLDIFTETDKHILINIEMQNEDYDSYPDRNLFYGGKVIVSSSLQKGDDYDKMKKTVMITILDSARYCHGKLLCPFRIMEEETREQLSDKLSFLVLQLRAVDTDKPVEQLTPIETFAAYIRYAGDPDMAEYIGKLLDHGKEYLAATESAFDEVSRSDTMVTERDRYYIKMSENKTILRERVEKATADGEKIGEARGQKIGEAQGRKAEQRDIAANMLSMDIDIHTISRATGLSEDEIRSLQ